MIDLTEKQYAVLTAIEAHIKQNGFPPTRKELCEMLSLRSQGSGMDYHLLALERKGYVQVVPGVSRGLRLTEKAKSIPILKTEAH